ncbi:CbrC family protein [Streptomyces sp. NPDC102351]|uniref:CbrC family protein n=1 Tax=Streptomyces sp. NPDC102351 TaxID=3366158 RepID=UPI0037FE1930
MNAPDLPFFRYHPDPVATGAVREGSEECARCHRRTGWIYTATFYTAQDVSGDFCPWCIADGSAAEQFDGDFSDTYGLDGVGMETVREVTRRTPGFRSWQDPHWLVHCDDAAAFLGEAGPTELARYPDALDRLRADLREDGLRDPDELERFLACLGEDAIALLFRCIRCGTHLAYVDAS